MNRKRRRVISLMRREAEIVIFDGFFGLNSHKFLPGNWTMSEQQYGNFWPVKASNFSSNSRKEEGVDSPSL